MARGITQDQVNRAADAILGAGENPTVEKVRAELGTGSPNTITRMLDSWRGQLGERLRQLGALPDVPDSVGQVMIELWRLAAEQAERALESRFARERSALEAAQALLAQERESWAARLEAAQTNVAQAQAARDLAEHACSTLDGQLQDSHALRADLLHQRDRLQDQCDLQSVQIHALRAQLDANQAAIRTERDRLEAHIRTVEDRAHLEVDQARQDVRQWQQRNETAERTHRSAVIELEKRHDAMGGQARQLEQEIARQTGQIAALEKALAEVYSATQTKQRSKPATSKAATKRVQSKKPATRKRNPTS
ncbi:DNA-binding protein [Dyella soli]|uniref:DNA-binding protein n=1 Tax=Dyella soli TaxID=522319 RepID=A0A4R0YUZ8_9GAMM|nr:DNA-binding protein [Dyella soli]TCI10140.1 DNA-binding protein [Dyella soli]